MPQIPAHYRVLDKSRRRPRAGARIVGPADTNEIITTSVRVRRRPDAPALPDSSELAATPRGERQYISREDFAAHYGAAQEDLDKIAAFGRENGLEVVESSTARRTVVLRGTAAQISKAFA
ncbi:MAG TPA: protease pro-enzyme activation domain-containing protein, partial [Bryobacteraceae bacterium]|nr:protease pro-enzyme activation domain-containing protein [Bryobacteraceae bacterium]